MQLFSASTGIRQNKRARTAKQEVPAEQYLPYARLVSDTMVETTEGHFLQVIRLDGFSFETADQSTINAKKAVRNQLIKGLATSEYAVYAHTIRRRRDVMPEGDFDPGFAKDLADAWNKQLSRRKQYTNDLYLTIVRKQPEMFGRASGMVNHFNKKAPEALAAWKARARTQLTDVTARFIQTLDSYDPELLSVYESEGIVYSEIAEFLSFLANLRLTPVAIPDRRSLSDVVLRSRPIFHGETIEHRSATETRQAAILSVKEYTDATAPGMTDGMLELDHEFIMSQSFRLTDRTVAMGHMKEQQRKLQNSEDDGVSQTEEIDLALDETQSNEIGFGLHHCTVLTWAPSMDRLRDSLAAIEGELIKIGVTAVREDVNLEAAFYAQFPGNFRFCSRAAPISTKNFASFVSMHSFPQGRARKNHWAPGHALTVLQTLSYTPYHFNFHRGDRGNTIVFGPTGTGKTLTTNFLIAQMRKYPGHRHVHLDKDRGAEIFIRAMGGKYYVIQTGKPTGWNPFRLPPTEETKEFWSRLFRVMLTLKADGEAMLSVSELNQIDDAVNQIEHLNEDERVLRHIASFFGKPTGNNLAQRLTLWYGPGANAWLFDNEENSFDIHDDFVGFDLTSILSQPTGRTAAMYYIFHMLQRMLDGRPTSIMLDEGWKALDDKLFEDEIEDLEFTIRKKNGMLIFATQVPESVLQSKVAPALINQSETMILFPNEKATREIYCKYLGLSEKQFQIIKKTDKEARVFIVKHGDQAVVAKLDMHGMDDAIAVLSGRVETVRLLDQIRAEVGDDPAAWLPIFQERRKML